MARTASKSHTSKRRKAHLGLIDVLFRPVDAASLVVLRVVFGVLMVVLILRLFITGDIERLYLAQTIRFSYPLFDWLPAPSPVVFRIVLGIAGVAAFFVAIGFYCRWACAVLFLAWSYSFFIDQTPYQNHDYLMCLLAFLFLLMPLNRMFAVDSWRRPEIRSEAAPAWCVYVLRFQIAIVYIFGGIRKLNPDWLHGEPIRTMLHTKAFEHSIVGEWLFNESVVMFFAWGGLVLDLLIVPALLWRRTRMWAFIVALLFHVMNAWLWEIDVFPWFMMVAALIFFPSDYPRRIVARLRRRALVPGESLPVSAATQTPAQKAMVTILAVYAAIQILLPCRPFLYPGHPLEQPDLLVFSWNMMLRVSTTQARFIVVDNDTGERWVVEPKDVLTKFQMGRLGLPNALQATARELARHKRHEGHTRVSVYAQVRQSVHGRAWEMAVDPTVDLAAIPRSLGVKSWVLPFMDRVPPDPSAHTAFEHAEWEFCKQEHFLPLHKTAADPQVVAKVRAWEAAHSGEASETAIR